MNREWTEGVLQMGSDSVMREGKRAGKFFRKSEVYFDKDSTLEIFFKSSGST